MKTIRTTCPYCGVGCGVLASVDDAGAVVSSLHSTVSSLARRPLVSEPA